MGGREMIGGAEFQARVGAYFSALIIARKQLPPYGLPRGVLTRIWHEQPGDAGDDIRLETANGLTYEVQVKHGLRADQRLAKTVARFASDLADGRYGLLLVDRGTSKTSITRDLPRVLELWRNDQEPNLSDALRRHLAPLLGPGGEHVRKRLVVGMVDLDEDHHEGALRAVDLLERHLVIRDKAEHAWSSLLKIALRAAREGHAHSRARLVELLAQQNVEVIADERASMAVAELRVNAPQAQRDPDVPDSLRPIVALIDRVHPSAAIDALDALPPIGPAFAREDAQRLTLRAAAHLQLDDPETARGLLEAALRRVPKYIPALLNLAVVEDMLGNQERLGELIRAAIASDPGSPKAWAARIHLLGDVGRADVPEAVGSETVVLTAFGGAALRRSQPQAAVQLLDGVVATQERFDPHVASLLASALALAAAGADPSLSGELRERAVSLLNDVIERVVDPRASIRASALWNRAVLLEALDQPLAALAGYRDLISTGNVSPELISRYAQRAIASGRDVEEALEAVDSLLAEHWRAILASLRVRLLRAREDVALARVALAELREQLNSHELSVEDRIAVANAALDLEDSVVAGEVLAGVPDDGLDARIHVLRARTALLSGDEESSVSAEYELALHVARPEQEQLIRLEYAAHLRTERRYRDVIRVLLPVADRPDTRVLRTLVEVCYAAREFSKAKQFAERAGSGAWWAARVLGFIALLRQDLARAEEHFDRWRTLAPEKIEPLLWAVELRLRRADVTGAKTLLTTVDATGLEPMERLRLAGLWLRTEAPGECLELALDALRDGYTDDEVLGAFVQLAMIAGPRVEYTAPSEVDVGVSVTLRLPSDATRTYLIVSDSSPETALSELSESNPLAIRLRGLKVGDDVAFRESPPRETATVVGLTNRHGHVARWALDELERRDPSRGAVRSFKVVNDDGELDLEPILEVLRSNAAKDAFILDEAEQKALPLAFVASALQRPIVEAYARFAHDEDRLLPVEELDAEPAIEAASNGRLVVTRTALVTLETIDALDALEAADFELLITPALVETLRRERHEHMEVARSGRTAMGLAGDSAAMHTTPAEVGRAFLEAHDRLQAWVLERCKTVLPDVPEDQNAIWKNLTEEAEQSVLVAHQTGAALLTDDLGLRRLAQATRPVRGTSTFALFAHLHRKGAMSSETLAKRVVALLELGHAALPIDVNHMLIAMRRDPTHLRVFARLLRQLRAPHMDGVPVARFLVRVLRSAALDPVVPINTATLASLCFETVLGPRPEREKQLAEVLRRAIRGDFVLLPVTGERFLAQLAQFRAVRRGGIQL